MLNHFSFPSGGQAYFINIGGFVPPSGNAFPSYDSTYFAGLYNYETNSYHPLFSNRDTPGTTKFVDFGTTHWELVEAINENSLSGVRFRAIDANNPGQYPLITATKVLSPIFLNKVPVPAGAILIWINAQGLWNNSFQQWDYNDQVYAIVPINPECSDGYDNDGDGKMDFPSDPSCSSADDNAETEVSDDCTPQNATAVLVEYIQANSPNAQTAAAIPKALPPGDYLLEIQAGAWSAWASDVIGFDSWFSNALLRFYRSGKWIQKQVGLPSTYASPTLAEASGRGKFIPFTIDGSQGGNLSLSLSLEDNFIEDNRGGMTLAIYRCKDSVTAIPPDESPTWPLTPSPTPTLLPTPAPTATPIPTVETPTPSPTSTVSPLPTAEENPNNAVETPLTPDTTGPALGLSGLSCTKRRGYCKAVLVARDENGVKSISALLRTISQRRARYTKAKLFAVGNLQWELVFPYKSKSLRPTLFIRATDSLDNTSESSFAVFR